MVQFHRAVGMFQLHRVGWFRCLRLFFDQLKNPSGTGQGILKLCHHTGNLVEWLRVLIGVT